MEIFHGLKFHFDSNGARCVENTLNFDQFLMIDFDLFRQTLTIYKLHPDDSGKYFCRVNDIETSAWLEVTRKKAL